jgi:hypothetical protein
MRARAAVPVVLAVLLSACASAPPPPVSVDANQKDLNALAGSWWGDYFSGSTGRTGSIRFTLNAEEGAVYGTVLMFPQGRSSSMEPANRSGSASADTPRGGQPLSIRFIVIEDGVVSGTLEPYKDPDCGCLLSTTFTGRIHGDVIQGTFVSHGGPGRLTQDGRWKVTRKAGS